METLVTDNPHYGDGVYFTLHENLINAHDHVKNAHGSGVAKRDSCLKFLIIRPDQSLKIPQTGGVCRNKIDNFKQTGDLFFLNDKIDIEFLGFEEYSNGIWVPYQERG